MTARESVGRRIEDIECQKHDERMDSIEEHMSTMSVDVHRNTGRFTAMLWFMGILGGIIGSCLIFLVAKTTSIESLLTDNKVTLMQHSEQINALKQDVTEIKEQHKFEAQNVRLH